MGTACAATHGLNNDQNLVTGWQLDQAGDVVAEISTRTGGSDGQSLKTCYAYDAQLRLVQVTEDCGSAAGGHQNLVTGYGYDPAGDRLTITDGLGNTSSTAYDNLGRAVSVTDALGNLQQTRHSPAGEVIATVNARGQTNTLTLDRLGRVVQETYLRADGVTQGTITYGYNADGNRTSFADSDVAQATVTYDHAGRVLTVTAPTGVTGYTYFLDGAVKTVSDATGTTSFTEDQLGRPKSTQDPLNGTALTSYTFNAGSQLTQRSEADGMVTRATYSGVGQLSTKTETAGTTVFASWANQFDLAGNRTQEASVLVGDPLAGTSTYAYDTLNQL